MYIYMYICLQQQGLAVKSEGAQVVYIETDKVRYTMYTSYVYIYTRMCMYICSSKASQSRVKAHKWSTSRLTRYGRHT